MPLSSEQVLALLRSLAVDPHRPPVCLELHASAGVVSYFLSTRGVYRGRLATALRDLVPGAVLVPCSPDRPLVTRAAQLRLSNKHRPLSAANPERIVRAVLSALTLAGRNEQLVVQLLIGPGVPAVVVPNKMPQSAVTPIWRLAVTGPGGSMDAESRAALLAKRGTTGLRLVMRLGVIAVEADRQRALLDAVLSGLRHAEAPGVSLALVPDSAERLHRLIRGWRWPLLLTADELLPLTGLPILDVVTNPPHPGQPPVHPKRVAPLTLAKPEDLVFGEAISPGVSGLIGHSRTDARQHNWIIGPTGGGKSTLLLNLAVQILQANLPLVVIEPKDLVTQILTRIPEHRLADVVILDPTDDQPVGANPLQADGRAPELIADQAFGLFDALYGDALGPRSSDLLRQCLAVLSRRDDASLVHLALMLTNPGLRRSLTQHAMRDDPLVSGPFWARFEALSPEAQSTIVAPLGNKLRPLLTPHLRRIVGQLKPRISVREIIANRKILLVPLQPGVVGPATSELLAAIIMSELWGALQGRVTVPENQRETVGVIIDEAQHYLRLPTHLSEALAESRGLGAAFYIAHQFRGQMPTGMLSALEANARSRIAFQLASADARAFAAGQSVLVPEDFTSLPVFEVYASLVRGGAVTPWSSVRMLPPPEETSRAAVVRRRSRQQYGQPLNQIEAAFAALTDASGQNDSGATTPDMPIGGRRPRRTS